MDEQLLLMNEMDRRFKIGDEIEGEILSIKDGELQISKKMFPCKKLDNKVQYYIQLN